MNEVAQVTSMTSDGFLCCVCVREREGDREIGKIPLFLDGKKKSFLTDSINLFIGAIQW